MIRKLWVFLGILAGYLSWPLVWVVIRHTTRTRILLNSGDKILVTRGWLSTGKWSLPGGGMHRGEKPAQAVLRELREETNIELKEAQLKYQGISKQTKGLPFRYHLFSATAPKELDLKKQRIEIVDVQWLDRQELLNKSVEQHVREAVQAMES